MNSNYENSVKTTTTDLLDNKLGCLRCSDEHLRCKIEKIKNLREQNFEGEANSKVLDEEDAQRSKLNKLCWKSWFFNYYLFYCVRYL